MTGISESDTFTVGQLAGFGKQTFLLTATVELVRPAKPDTALRQPLISNERYTPVFNTEADLMLAIRTTPQDDLPRLSFADWLDDHGANTLANFIRESIAYNELIKHFQNTPGNYEQHAAAIERLVNLTMELKSTEEGRASVAKYWNVSPKVTWEFYRIPVFALLFTPGDGTRLFIDRGFPGHLVCKLDSFFGVRCLMCRDDGYVSHRSSWDDRDYHTTCQSCQGKSPRRAYWLSACRDWPLTSMKLTDMDTLHSHNYSLDLTADQLTEWWKYTPIYVPVNGQSFRPLTERVTRKRHLAKDRDDLVTLANEESVNLARTQVGLKEFPYRMQPSAVIQAMKAGVNLYAHARNLAAIGRRLD